MCEVGTLKLSLLSGLPVGLYAGKENQSCVMLAHLQCLIGFSEIHLWDV
jgi:hypothetical protein